MHENEKNILMTFKFFIVFLNEYILYPITFTTTIPDLNCELNNLAFNPGKMFFKISIIISLLVKALLR